MALFFWQFDNYNDIQREWICFSLNIFVFLFTIIALIRSYQFYRKITFQTIPLTFNLISTLVLLLLKLFQKGYQFDIIGYLIEVFTYFLFGFTFFIIKLKMKKQKNHKFKQKVASIFLFIISGVILVMIILVAFKIISKKCDRNLLLISIILLVVQAVTYLPTIFYGKQILQILKKKKNSTLTQTMLQTTFQIKNSLSDQFTIQRRKQIYLVLILYTISLIIRCALMIVSIVIDNTDVIECQQIDGIVIITSDYIYGQVILILIEINQLLPHIIIPIALFIVPMKGKRRKHHIVIDSSNQSISFKSQQQQQIQDRSQMIKSRISSVFSDKAASPSKIY